MEFDCVGFYLLKFALENNGSVDKNRTLVPYTKTEPDNLRPKYCWVHGSDILSTCESLSIPSSIREINSFKLCHFTVLYLNL